MRFVGIICLLVAVAASEAAASPVLFGMSVNRQMLLTIDTQTGQPTDVASVGVVIQDIAFNTSDGFIYGYDASLNGRLLRIDAATGAATNIGEPFGLPGAVHGMAYDPNGDQFYATNKATSDLYRIDPYSGAFTVVGTMSHHVWGLAFDGATDTLFGWVVVGAQIPVEIDTQDASITVIGDGDPLGPVEGLTFDPTSGLLYGVRIGNPVTDSVLITLDPATAELTEIGVVGTDDFISGLAISPEPGTLLLLALGCTLMSKRRRP
ncbi:MAG: PEP-CTERM sorting domain-containing protein [bacterium]|nr:PEP-CTERM sorting domain-containing protein [bacterium]